MTGSDYHPRKIFTVEEANKTLPLVSVIARDLAIKSRLVVEMRQRLTEMTSNRGEHDGTKDFYSEEVEQMQTELEGEIRDLAGYEAELRQLGVHSKSGPDGVVDFPAMLDGEIVMLCWKLGETELMHWHRVGENFEKRHRLAAGMTLDSDSF